MKHTTVLAIILMVLVAACGSGTVGEAGQVPDIADDTAAHESFEDLLTTPVDVEGEPSEPKIVLTKSDGEQITETAIDGGAVIDDSSFATDERVTDLMNDLAATIDLGGDLRPLVCEPGLYLAYNAGPVSYSRDDLAGILSDETAYQWPSHMISADDPAAVDLPYRTFAEEIGGSFLAAFNDPANQFLRNEWRDLDERGIPEEANPLPIELREFDTISVTDSGHDGIEWFVWYVSVDYEKGQPCIVGLTFDAWTP